MKDTAKIDISVKALREMTQAQHEALATEILTEDKWTAQDEIRIRWDAPFTKGNAGTIMCQMMCNGNTSILLGIEPDGYVHS